MKTLEYLYQEAQIHFLVHPGDENVMINATEMAKAYGRRLDHFLRSDHAKAFIGTLLFTPYGGNKLEMDDIIKANKKAGTYVHRILALKLAAWLDPAFEVWIYSKIEEITFGNYKKHYDAHAEEEAAKLKMAELKSRMLEDPDKEMVQEYFKQEGRMKNAKKAKVKAIRNQYRLFDEQ